jgi:heterodisulfide reductase subunit A-like polyferredoxin
MGSLKQTRYVREQHPDADIYVFYIDLRAPGRLEDFLQVSQEDEKLHLIKGKVARVDVDGDHLLVQAEDVLSGTRVTRAADLVVLATGIVPSDVTGIRFNGGLKTDEHGFLARTQSSEGVLVAGCAARPTDVATSVRDATGAVMNALQFCTEQ